MTTMRRFAAMATAIAVIGALLSGCAAQQPITTPTVVKTMTPEESKAQVQKLFNVAKDIIGGDWKISTDTWGDCTQDGGSDSAIYDLGAQRWSQPLPEDQETLAVKVRDALIKLGYDVRIQHDPNLKPPRTVIGYPGGYLQGTEPDGFGFLFDIGKDRANFSASGRCVLGDFYTLNTGKTDY